MSLDAVHENLPGDESAFLTFAGGVRAFEVRGVLMVTGDEAAEEESYQ
jgi:hypothetical protein